MRLPLLDGRSMISRKRVKRAPRRMPSLHFSSFRSGDSLSGSDVR